MEPATEDESKTGSGVDQAAGNDGQGKTEDGERKVGDSDARGKTRTIDSERHGAMIIGAIRIERD